MEEDILFFKKLKDRAIIIRRSSELGNNADLITVMNIIMLKELGEKLIKKDDVEPVEVEDKKSPASKK